MCIRDRNSAASCIPLWWWRREVAHHTTYRVPPTRHHTNIHTSEFRARLKINRRCTLDVWRGGEIDRARLCCIRSAGRSGCHCPALSESGARLTCRRVRPGRIVTAATVHEEHAPCCSTGNNVDEVPPWGQPVETERTGFRRPHLLHGH